MEMSRTIEGLCTERKLSHQQLSEQTGIEEGRVLAIILGRWTPSPEERDRIAKVFNLTRDQIAWGHKTPIQHIYGSGPA
jgi:transcriptional regulator with XRE-family HTH domain